MVARSLLLLFCLALPASRFKTIFCRNESENEYLCQKRNGDCAHMRLSPLPRLLGSHKPPKQRYNLPLRSRLHNCKAFSDSNSICSDFNFLILFAHMVSQLIRYIYSDGAEALYYSLSSILSILSSF